MAVVATGYVRLRVLSAGLENDIRDAVQRAVGKMDRDMQQQGRRLGAQMRQGIRTGLRRGTDVEDEGEEVGKRAGRRVVQGAEREVRQGIGPALARAFRVGARRSEPAIIGSFRGLTARLGGAITRLFGGRFVARAFGGLTGALSGFLGGIKAFAKPEITSWFWSIGTALTTMIVPSLAWIGGNAARGVGILAAGFSSLAISGGLLAVALTRDTEEMKAFKAQWTELADIIGKPIQEEFLNRTTAGMERLKKLAQDLEPEFRELGAAWGDAFDQFTVMLGTEKSLGNIQRILRTSAKTTRDFGTATTNVVDGFLTLLAHAEPLVNYVSEGAVKMSEWFKNTLDAKAASGDLDKSMQKVLDKWRQTWDTVKDFGEGVRNIFRAASPVTEKFGDAMGRVADKFLEWTSDPGNQERMTAFFEKAYTISGKVVDVFGDLAVMAGRAFEKLDEGKILRVLGVIQDKLVPAIQGMYNQFKGENAEKWVQFFENMAGALQKIVDSGAIETVGGFVADAAVKFSELVNTDAAGWFLGVYLALQPLQGLLSGIVPLLASLFYGLRIAGMLGAGGAAAGAAGAAGAAASGAGAAAAGGFLAGWKGVLRGGIVGFIAGEILSAASEDFSVAWDSLWSGVFDVGGKVLSKVGDAASIPVNYFSAFIHRGLGDESAAQADIDRANAQVKKFMEIFTDLDNWNLNRSNDPNSPTGNTILDKYVIDESKATQFKQSWDQVATNVRTHLANIGESLGAGREVVSVKYNSILNELNKVPSTPALDSLKKSIGISMQNIATEFANGDTNIHASITSLYDMMIRASQQDPSFEPTRQAIVAQLQGIEKEFTLSQIPQSFTDMMSKLSAATSDIEVGSGLQGLKDNIITQLGDLSQAIETRSPEVPAKITAMMDLLNQIPADAPPALQEVKGKIIEDLTAIGYGAQVAGSQAGADAAAGIKQIETNVASSLKALSEITLPEPEWTNMRWDMKPLYNDIQEQAASLGEAITSGSADLPARVQSLVDMLNKVPADAPPQLQSLKNDISTQLQALGYTVTADGQVITANMAAAMSGVTDAATTGAQGIGTGIAQKLREGSSLTQAEMDTAIAALTGKVNSGLGGTVPAAISGTGPALTGAMLKATQGIPLTAEEQFALANAQAAAQASAMPSAVAPGLAGVLGAVISGLQGVPASGSTPFTTLGNNLANIVGGFAGKIIPGLSTTAQQPESKFNPITSTGVAPWLTMSAAIIGAMNSMNASVARVLAAVAAVVVSAWAIIGRANAAGLAGTLDAVTATVAAARIAERATQTVVDQVIQIARLMIGISRAVTEAREAKDKVTQYAAEAAQAVVRAASAASTAAGAAANAASAAANAAASRAAAGAVPAAEGGIFNPTPGGTLTLIAEAGRRERVEPLDSQGLSRRDRAMISYIVSQISVGSGGGGDTKVVVNLDGRELSGVVSSVVTSRLDSEARQIKQRRRRSA